MKILMIAPEPVFEPRGTPFSIVGRMKTLSDMGHEVDLVTYPIGQDIPFPRVRFLRTCRIPGIRKIKIGPSLAKIPLDAVLSLKTVARLVAGRYDVIHSHEEAGFWGVILARAVGIPHIYDMHSSLPQQLSNFEFSRSRLLVGIFEALENQVLRLSRAVITICPDLDQYVSARFPDGKSVMIENVLDYDMIFPRTDQPKDVRAELGLGRRPVALYAGTFEPYQGLDLLIESAAVAVPRFPSAVFLCVGGHPGQVEACREKTRRLGIDRAFYFTGQVSPQAVSDYVAAADLLLSPRISGTNTPLKIYSYLRSGIPVVATRLWTHTQVLDDTIAVLTKPTPADFAAGICQVLEDRPRAARIGEAARRRADEQYSEEAYREKLGRVYARVSGRG